MSLVARAFVILSVLIPSFKAQVNLSTNLLKTVPINRPLVFDVRVEKQNIGNFCRFQMDLPAGVSVQEMESQSGTFSIEGNKVKIIWVTTPPENEFLIRMKLLPLKQAGQGRFSFSFYYVQGDVKKEWHSVDYPVRFKDTVLPVLLSAPMVNLGSGAGSIQPITATTNTVGKTPAEIQQQVAQLRKEAREARTVGEREKKSAAEKLKKAGQEEKAWQSKPASSQRSAALDNAKAERQSAQEAMQVAERILTLSSTLNANADEIERISRRMHPVADKESKKEKTAPPALGGNRPGETFYAVQVGAFSAPPSVKAFQGMGKVTIQKAGAAYKVMVGQFTDKAEAYALRDRLNTTYPGAFVVKVN